MAAAGVSALLMYSTRILLWLKVFGACYMFFLAWKSSRGVLNHNGTMVVRVREKQIHNLWFYLKGVGIHLTNPKAILIWLTVTPSDSALMRLLGPVLRWWRAVRFRVF